METSLKYIHYIYILSDKTLDREEQNSKPYGFHGKLNFWEIIKEGIRILTFL